MRKIFVMAALACWSIPACAQEPVGCDKFKWPADRERTALNASDVADRPSGAQLAGAALSVRLKLRPHAAAELPKAPERTPKDNTFSGVIFLASDLARGTYSIALSDYAWLDVIQNGAMLKPVAFSGVTGCDGIRKVVRFELSNAPLAIQVSGVTSDTIRIAVTPVRD